MRKTLKTLLAASILASLTACGQGATPGNAYVPQQFAPAPTVRQPAQANLPTVQIQNRLVTFPEGTTPTGMRFDMDIVQVEDNNPLPEAQEDPNAETQSTETVAEPQADELSVPVGTTEQFTVEITLDNGETMPKQNKINWVSTNRDVATVSSTGVITPVTEGTTKIIGSIGGVATQMVVHVVPGNFIWQQMQSPTQANLYGVKLVSDTEGWAVGAGGTVLHFVRGQWYNLTQQLHPVTQGATLYSIDMISPQEGWAVGDNIVMYFRNGRWTRVQTPTPGTFRSVDMLMPGVGWIVGENAGTSVALTLRGNMGWQPMVTGIDDRLNGVSVVGPNHVWAVGDSGHLSRAGIYQFNGMTWEKVRFTNNLIDWKRPTGKYSMKAIKMVNSSQGWAVGTYDPLLSSVRGKRGAIFKYDAINDIWTEVELHEDTDDRYEQVTYNAVGMMNPNEGWILGNTVTAALDFSPNPEVNGNLMKTNGQSVAPATDFQAQALPQAFNGIDVVEHGNGVIVGDRGLILHRQYDINYRYKRGNFANFNGEFGQGYIPGQSATLNTTY